MAQPSLALKCEHVVKRYGDLVAVNDVSLEIAAGEIFGLVGPNGAGKTTLIEMIESLRKPDEGLIRVLGLDPRVQSFELRERIGVQLQSTSIQPNLKVMEAIGLFASLYRKSLPHPQELLETLSLADKANSRFRKLSGGQKQRVAIALALVNDPEILFFDEITTGLDPQARRAMWDLLRGIRGRGKTVFLTTHYMEEAEALCDRVAVIDHGRIIALDTPANLVRNLGAGTKVLFRVTNRAATPAEFAGLPAVTRAEEKDGGFVLYTSDGNATLQELIRHADRAGLGLDGIRTETPNLDDVFLALTGREMRE
jgi:ABC-2 type transport system ATP-binding protein